MQQYVLYQLIRWTRYQASFIKGLEGIFLKGSFLCIFSFDCGAGYHRMIPPTIVRIPSAENLYLRMLPPLSRHVPAVGNLWMISPPPPHFMKWHWIERYIKVVSSQFQNVTLLFCKTEKVFKSFYFPSSFCTDDVCGGRGNEIWLLVVWMCHHFSLFVKSTSNQQENWNFSKSKEKIQICLTFPHYIRISNPVGRKRRIKWILKPK